MESTAFANENQVKNIYGLSHVISNPKSLKDPEFRKQFATALIEEGKRLLALHKKGVPIGKLKSELLEYLNKPFTADKFSELMKTEDGREVLRKVVSTTPGDFLVLGVLFNSIDGAAFVGKMFLSEEGRKTIAAIFGAACSAPIDPYFAKPFVSKITSKGLEDAILNKTNKLITTLGQESGKESYVDLFDKNEMGVRATLRKIIETPEGRQKLIKVLVSENGRDFLADLGDIRTRIAGEDLWLTTNGRLLVKDLLKEPKGLEVLYILATGTSIGSSLIEGSIPLRQETMKQ